MPFLGKDFSLPLAAIFRFLYLSMVEALYAFNVGISIGALIVQLMVRQSCVCVSSLSKVLQETSYVFHRKNIKTNCSCQIIIIK